MNVLFDTNVLIAAIITEGICSRLLHRARAGEFTLVTCPYILKELRNILLKKFRLSQEEAETAIVPISEAIGRVIEHDLKINNICRDADDDNIIARALAAKAEYLVTGDADLLEIKKYQGINIINPRDFEALFV